MSLINDMLRDLDTRRARLPEGNMTALPNTGNMDKRIGKQGIVYATAGGTLLVAGLLTILLINDAPAQILAHLQGTAAADSPTTLVPSRLQDTPISPSSSDKPASAATGLSAENPELAPDKFVDTLQGNLSAQAPYLQPAPVSEEIITSAETTMPIKASRARQSRSRNMSAPVDKSVTAQSQQDSFQDTQTQSSITLRTPDPKQQLTLDFRQAANIAATGQDITAINILENILASDASHHPARLLLASLYIRQQRNMNAESVLTAGLARFPQHAPYAHLQAQLLVSQERFTQAITLLNTALPGAMSDAGYHALLAGLLQRTGEPADAARHYTTALQLAPGHGEWWMGLGISQEQAGNHNAAQAAYQQALQHPLKSTLLKYINHRLQQLPAQPHGPGSPDNSHGKV